MSATTKDTQISIRVSTEWLARIDRAAGLWSDALGVPISRSTFIEKACEMHASTVETNSGAGGPGRPAYPE